MRSAATHPVPDLTPQRTESSFLGRSAYMTGDDLAIDEDDATRYEPHDAITSLSAEEYQSHVSPSASFMNTLPQSVEFSLVQSFLERGKPWMPIIDRSDLNPVLSQRPPTLLVTAVLVAGSKLSTSPNALDWGAKSYIRAKSLFFYGTGHNALQRIITSILLQWWNPSGPEHVSLDSSTLWLKITVGLAHQIGLHREPSRDSSDAGLRRRLWWTIVNRDNQIATSHGRPRVLDPRDSNVKPLCPKDFNDPDHPDSLLFISFVCINSILGDMVCHHRRGSLSERHRMDIEQSLLQWLQGMPASLRLFDHTSQTLSPYNLKLRQLYVPFFVALMIFYRPESRGSQFSLASLLAASCITRIYEEFIDWGDITFLAPTFIFYILVAGLTQLSAHRYLDLTQRAKADIQTVRVALTELKKRFPTAHGAERIFENILRKSQELQSPSITKSSLPRALSDAQQELFSHFGPELCPLWSLDLGNPTDHRSTLFGDSSWNRKNDAVQEPQQLHLQTQTPVASVEMSMTDNRELLNGRAPEDSVIQPIQVVDPAADFDLSSLDYLWPEWLDGIT
ncbi:fungal-specific transcription factor domain-containing protein [Trichoderma velutinum]